jgi:putative membrane protein
MQIPKWLGSHIDEQSLKKIKDAVVSAEAQTTGEIVPMIVRSSSPAGHMTCLLFFLLLAFFDLCLFVYLTEFQIQFIAEIQLACILAALILGTTLSKLTTIQRLLTPRSDRKHNALVRAELEFHRSKIRATSAHTGVLLFVSLMERQAVVLADEKVVEKLHGHSWDEILKSLTDGLKRKDFALGFSKALGETGQLLAKHFPASSHGVPELPNELQIKE